MRPDFDRSVVNNLKFGRDFNPITVWIFNEDKEVIARAMSSWSPN
jgi:hypothetical protein